MKTQLRTRKQRGGSSPNRNMDEVDPAVPLDPDNHLPPNPGPVPLIVDTEYLNREELPFQSNLNPTTHPFVMNQRVSQTLKIRIPKKRISRRRPKENTRFSIPSRNNIRLVLSEREIEQVPPRNVRPPLSERPIQQTQQTQRRNRPPTDFAMSRFLCPVLYYLCKKIINNTYDLNANVIVPMYMENLRPALTQIGIYSPDNETMRQNMINFIIFLSDRINLLHKRYTVTELLQDLVDQHESRGLPLSHQTCGTGTMAYINSVEQEEIMRIVIGEGENELPTVYNIDNNDLITRVGIAFINQ
jgi:hypothetical protein